MPRVNQDIENFARIKVIGIGGSGKGALNHMINSQLDGVEFIAMNTDTQDLHNTLAEKKITIGRNLTRGLGAGMDPEVGKRAAEETREDIQNSIKGSDMIFITCGLGGGTGTGAAPIVASIAKSEDILTVAVVTKPFFFEGAKRMALADKGLEELEKEVDALIVIPNDRIFEVIDRNVSFEQAFEIVDEILKQAVEGISDIIRNPGHINVDFADIRRILKDSGTALMGVGRAKGENRAREAATIAINSPLLDVSINGAHGVLFCIYGPQSLSMVEVQEAAKIITESADKDAQIIFGVSKDETLHPDEIKVTVIATGFPASFKSDGSRSAPVIRDTIPVRDDNQSRGTQLSRSLSTSTYIPQSVAKTAYDEIRERQIHGINGPLTTRPLHETVRERTPEPRADSTPNTNRESDLHKYTSDRGDRQDRSDTRPISNVERVERYEPRYETPYQKTERVDNRPEADRSDMSYSQRQDNKPDTDNKDRNDFYASSSTVKPRPSFDNRDRDPIGKSLEDALEEDTSDDTDDWNSLPPFLRRIKKNS